MKTSNVCVWLIAAPLAAALFWQTQGCSHAAPAPFRQPDGAYNNVSPWQESNDEIQETCAKAVIEAAKKVGTENKIAMLAVYKRCLLKQEAFI